MRGRTRLLVMQGTPYCNLSCDYCYLPNRDDRSRMPHEVVHKAVAWLYDHGLASDPLSVVWHAGEPLTLPPSWYAEAFARAAAAAGGPLVHSIQTNGVALSDRWCDLFLEHGVQVGVSLDGPARLHDARRRTRKGGGTHAMVMRGIDLLRRRGVPFHVICVVTSATLDAPDELADFFLAEGVGMVCFNVEEIEGANTRSSLATADTPDRYRRFLDRVLERTEQSGGLAIREAETLLGQLLDPRFGEIAYNDQNTPFSILTVTHTGEMATFSPELAGLSHPVHGSFHFGNVDSTLEDALRNPRFNALWAEVQTGVEACAARCRYFRLCGGGAPANKLAEHGHMAGTETMHCRLANQATADALLCRLERKLTTV